MPENYKHLYHQMKMMVEAYQNEIVPGLRKTIEGMEKNRGEVVHGRWKYYHRQNKAVCTNCSFERDLDENFGRAISCPNCGADMRERKEDERKDCRMD